MKTRKTGDRLSNQRVIKIPNSLVGGVDCWLVFFGGFFVCFGLLVVGGFGGEGGVLGWLFYAVLAH